MRKTRLVCCACPNQRADAGAPQQEPRRAGDRTAGDRTDRVDPFRAMPAAKAYPTASVSGKGCLTSEFELPTRNRVPVRRNAGGLQFCANRGSILCHNYVCLSVAGTEPG
jgi:hypothetical protein